MTGTIGEQLKKARLAQGISLEQVSKSTHIKKVYLEALEEDKRSEIPSNVQGRGFLRLYADALKLAVEPLLAAWEGKEFTAEPGSAEGKSQPPAGWAAETTLGANETDTHLTAGDFPELEITSDVEGGSSAIFREIGKQLRVQREVLGLSLAEVERYTRLRQHYILALESGRLEDMPSPVQGRGMLSNYAAFINLDEEKILLRFAEGLQARRIERIPKTQPVGLFNPKKRAARPQPMWKRFLTPDLIFGVGLAAIIFLFIVWTAARIDTLRSDEIEPTPPAISEILLTPASARTLEVSPTVVANRTSLPKETAVVFLPANETSPAVETNPLPVNSQPLEPQTTEQAGVTATLPPMNQDPLQIYIVARQRSWLRVIADDKVKFLGRVVPGNAYAFSGEKKIEMSTGNAAGLQVFFNQNDLGTLGLIGEVVELVFSPEGVMTPTPAAPPTGTPTKPATITPLPSPTPKASPTITPFVP